MYSIYTRLVSTLFLQSSQNQHERKFPADHTPVRRISISMFMFAQNRLNKWYRSCSLTCSLKRVYTHNFNWDPDCVYYMYLITLHTKWSFSYSRHVCAVQWYLVSLAAGLSPCVATQSHVEFDVDYQYKFCFLKTVTNHNFNCCFTYNYQHAWKCKNWMQGKSILQCGITSFAKIKASRLAYFTMYNCQRTKLYVTRHLFARLYPSTNSATYLALSSEYNT